MGLLTRANFARGWCPDADAINGPVDALLRMDNCVLDELGVVALRQGSTKINGSPFADTDVHSLFTAVLSGTRYRLAGANNAVYANGTSIATGVNGSGDIAFGSHLGQLLFARGTTTKKYDGTTVRNWGLAMTGGAPTIAAVASDGKTLASCDLAESPGFVADEDDTSGVVFGPGQDGTVTGSAAIYPNLTTNRATMTKTFAAATDFTSYDSGGTGTDNDLLQLYVQILEPNDFVGVTVMVDVNASSAGLFQDDYYVHTFAPGDVTPIGPTPGVPLPIGLQTQRPHSNAVQNATVERAVPRASVREDKPVMTTGWSKLLVRRGDMIRTGSTSGKDWSTVKAVRVILTALTHSPILVDTIRLIANPLNGRYKWCYVLAYNSGTYVGLSAPSPLSAETQIQAQGATVTIPSDGARDSQANECWLYRMGGVMDAFYRVATKTSGVSGSFTISDALSDIDALTVGLKLQTDNTTPPGGIIGIAGPYYDRTFALTTTGVYPSRRLNPDSFASGQVITIAGADEVALWVRKALGGLYVATTKDVYRIDGTGAELPDGTIDFTKTPLNIDHPPINDGVAQDGNLLLYFADDGWRAISGAGSQLVVGDTSLLYKGQTRHGRGPVNTTTGRFRAVIAHGHLIAITPEGAETTSSTRIYRQAPLRHAWYYHVYPRAFRCLHREPDGTLLASDTSGTVWILDSGTGDAGAAIPIVLWTRDDHDEKPFQRKDPWDLRVTTDSGGASISVGVYLDETLTTTLVTGQTPAGLSVLAIDVDGDFAFTRAQLRVTGSCTTFRWYDFAIAYLEHAILQCFVEQRPVLPSATRRRFSGVTLIIDTLGAAASVTPFLDGVGLTAATVTTSEPLAHTVTFPAVVGRDLWVRVAKASGFELYEVTPRILEELPPVVQGRLPNSDAGYAGIKTLSGVRLRLCTLGVARTITVYLDNVAASQTFAVTTGANEPNEVTLAFTVSQSARVLALSFDGDVEVYTWAPIISSRQPLGVTSWDSGPIDLGDRELVWLRRLDLKVNAGAALVVTAYLDGVALVTTTAAITAGVDTIVWVDLPRGTKGRQPRLVVTSTQPFYPYWIRAIERVTGLGTGKPSRTIPVTLGGAAV